MQHWNLIRTACEGFRRLSADARAATAVEYGLLLGLIAVAIAASLSNVGSGLNAVFNTVVTNLIAAR